MRYKTIPAEHRIIRYVPWNKLLKDEEDNVLGVLWTAFEMRAAEQKLSVTWCEYYLGNDDECLRCGAQALRDSKVEVRPKGQFAVTSVGQLTEYLDKQSRNIRTLHEPTEDNPAHCSVSNWPKEEAELLARIAEDCWPKLYDKTAIDQLPTTECQKRKL